MNATLEAPPAPVLLMGDPRLRVRARPVADFGDPLLRDETGRLFATLEYFRRTHGYGRAIAAPQIGVPRRLVAVDLGDGPFLLANPEITWRSDETFTMWDDCMSFPGLLVRVRRHESLALRYQDEHGETQHWERLDRAASELLQHEIDHLDGVLFTDRAEGRDAFLLRPVFDSNRAYFRGQVDYVIGD
jgi:peptide deformylase